MKINIYENNLNVIKHTNEMLVCYFNDLSFLKEKKIYLTYEFQVLKNLSKIPFFVVFNGLNETDTEIAKFLGIENKKSAFFYIINNEIKNIEIDLNNINNINNIIDSAKNFL